MMHIIHRRAPTRFVLLGLLVVAAGCGGKRGQDEKQPERVETIGFPQGLNAHFSSRRTSPEFTNNTKFDLTDLDLTITFSARDPSVKEREEKVRWEIWRKGEKRTPEISVEKKKYSKVRVVGTAKRDGKPVKVSFGVDVL
jgi:hypothetical protein